MSDEILEPSYYKDFVVEENFTLDDGQEIVAGTKLIDLFPHGLLISRNQDNKITGIAMLNPIAIVFGKE